jgi:Protein of unknown function (DUF2510)
MRPRRTLSGRPVSVQEDIGTQARRARLMSEAVRRLEGHPLGEESAHGVALGDGYGMEDLVEHIAPLFQREISMARWVAIRGALLFLDMVCSSDSEWHELMPIMGLGPVKDPQTGEPTVVVLYQHSPVTPEVEQNILGLFWAITNRWGRYAEVAEMTVQQVNSDPLWAAVGPPMALDLIAWTAIAMLRTGQASSELISRMPEPGLLEQPGWYADPLFAKCERYWAGDDWTDRVRVKNGRTWNETSLPLR